MLSASALFTGRSLAVVYRAQFPPDLRPFFWRPRWSPAIAFNVNMLARQHSTQHAICHKFFILGPTPSVLLLVSHRGPS